MRHWQQPSAAHVEISRRHSASALFGLHYWSPTGYGAPGTQSHDGLPEIVQTHLPEGYQLQVSPPHHSNHPQTGPSDKVKALHLVELTICYETGFVEAERRKTACYAELVAEAQEAGYESTLTPLQVGSRGFWRRGGS